MESLPDKKYVLEDIMKKRKKDQEAVQNKIRSKISLKAKRAKKEDAMKNPEKFIKQYRSAQKSYSYLKNKVSLFVILEPRSRPYQGRERRA